MNTKAKILTLETMTKRLLESKQARIGLPPNTKIADVFGLGFSSWDGKLALVTTLGDSDRSASGEFRPDTLEQRYGVIFAIDSITKKPIPAHDKLLGIEPVLDNSSAQYHNTWFKVESQRIFETGTFLKPEIFWVKKKISELGKAQMRALIKYLEGNKDYWEMSHPYGLHLKVKVSEWARALKSKYSALDNDSDAYSVIDKVINDKALINWSRSTDEIDKQMDKEWALTQGIFVLNKNGSKVKLIIDKKNGRWK